MARRSDRKNVTATRTAGRRTSGASGATTRPRATRADEAQDRRVRSHGSSRPASATHGGTRARQPERSSARQASARSQQRADARQAARRQAGNAPARRSVRGAQAAHVTPGAQGAREQGARGAQAAQSLQAAQGMQAAQAARASQAERSQAAGPELTSRTVGELRRADRREQARKKSRRRTIAIIVAAIVVAAIVAASIVAYNSSLFSIANVKVNGVEHLTSDEMAQLANVPADSTLLRVDTETIEKRIEQNAWVADAQVNRVFPDTLEINVTERSVYAVVEVPTSAGVSIKQWAIAEDHVWLMPIPDKDSDAAKTTSAKIYEDAAHALHIVDVPFGTKAEIGQVCADSNINNALDILSGLTTELSGRIAQVSAAGTAETTLILDNGVEVAFGKAEDIRDKERVILKILEENEDNVAYINVRMVETPTWRAV